MTAFSKNDPLATNIGEDVIADALQSVSQYGPTPAEEPSAAPAADAAPVGAATAVAPADDRQALRDQLLEARQALRQREAELEQSQTLGRQTLEKLKEEHERTLRAAADLENHKKRAVRERDETLKYGQERLLRDLLPVLDNLDRALEHASSPADFEALKTGIQMNRKLCEDTLGRHGVKAFSALGQAFDPNLHEAMQAVESDAPPGTVLAQMVRGYLLNGRMMRPAMVVVARAPATPPEPAREALSPEAVEGTPPADETTGHDEH